MLNYVQPISLVSAQRITHPAMTDNALKLIADLKRTKVNFFQIA